MTKLTLVRKSIFTRCKEAAQELGFTFEQVTLPEMGGRIVYVVNGKQMTPGEAAEFLRAE